MSEIILNGALGSLKLIATPASYIFIVLFQFIGTCLCVFLTPKIAKAFLEGGDIVGTAMMGAGSAAVGAALGTTKMAAGVIGGGVAAVQSLAQSGVPSSAALAGAAGAMPSDGHSSALSSAGEMQETGASNESTSDALGYSPSPAAGGSMESRISAANGPAAPSHAEVTSAPTDVAQATAGVSANVPATPMPTSVTSAPADVAQAAASVRQADAGVGPTGPATRSQLASPPSAAPGAIPPVIPPNSSVAPTSTRPATSRLASVRQAMGRARGNIHAAANSRGGRAAAAFGSHAWRGVKGGLGMATAATLAGGDFKTFTQSAAAQKLWDWKASQSQPNYGGDTEANDMKNRPSMRN